VLLPYLYYIAERQQSTGSLMSALTPGVPEAKNRVCTIRLLTDYKFTSFACVVAELRGTVAGCLTSTSSRSLSLTNLSDSGLYRDFGRWTQGWLGRSKGRLSLWPFCADFFSARPRWWYCRFATMRQNCGRGRDVTLSRVVGSSPHCADST
jgi:hypothetical protein